VQNYPWGEIHCYVIDARAGVMDESGNFSLKGCRFAKTLHVSPFHPHPEKRQYYLASFELKKDSSVRSFSRLMLSLRLYEADDACLLFSSCWSLGNLTRRRPKPLLIGLQTTARILREAASLSRTRALHNNVTNPVAPVGMQTVALAMIVTLLFLAWLPYWIAVPALYYFRMPDIPLLRDVWLGVGLCFIAKLILV
jgi:hypothetical protein